MRGWGAAGTIVRTVLRRSGQKVPASPHPFGPVRVGWLAAALLAADGCRFGGSTAPPADPVRAPPSIGEVGRNGADPDGRPRAGGEDLARAMAEASAGVEDAELATLLEDHYRALLEDDPLFATEIGVHAFDHRLPDPSAEARARWSRARRRFLARARAIDPGRLSATDRSTLRVFQAELAWAIDEEVCRFDEWTLSARSNPVTIWNELPRRHHVHDRASADAFLARVRQIPKVVDARVERLAAGARDGLYANAESARRVLAMVERQVDLPAEKWALVSLLSEGPDFEGRDAFVAAVRTEVDGPVRAAFARYGAFVRTRILPHARGDDAVGLAALPIGPACYAARIRSQTTLDLTPDRVHRIGLDEIARTDREIADLGRRILKTRSLSATIEDVARTPSLYFETKEQVLEAARRALADAEAAVPAFFGRLPRTPCEVREIPAHEAPFTTIAYYSPPHPDGSKPGEYFVNTYAPRTRPRYQARVLAFHESVPGHHFQIALSQSLSAVPAFRRYGGAAAFVEGWALYVERLAGEMGLYRGPMDELGVASFDAWRAGRLVVDTGIHHLGWSRSRAKAFLRAHTLLSSENIDNEVDRYIVWPGQALAYKIGQLEILRLRAEAKAALGTCFRLPRFHDALLGGGALPLSELRAQMETWRRAEAAACGAAGGAA